jgi:hypothetical protein
VNEKALDEANDVLFFDEIPTVSFEKGTVVDGIILAVERQQQREYRDAGNGPAMYWDREQTRPIWQVMVTIQTAELDPDDESDDGRRRVYLKGRAKANPESTQDAIRDAVKARKRKRIEVGAWMRLECYDETVSPNKNLNGTKLYRAWYREVGAPVPTMAEISGNNEGVKGVAVKAPAKKSA